MRFCTAGESHGPALTVIVEGCPAGLQLEPAHVDEHLFRRQKGFGRGARQYIESDRVAILSGVRFGETLGSPITLQITNKDHKNWKEVMNLAATENEPERAVHLPRPGHADLAGALKYDRRDARDILERASARETAAKVAAGAVALRLLRELDINIASCVTALGPVESPPPPSPEAFACLDPDMPMFDEEAALRAREAVKEAGRNGDTLGGRIVVRAFGVPAGLGSHVQWDRRIDGRLAQHFMAIPSVKAVAVGDGVAVSSLPGSRAQDAIYYNQERGFFRETNRAGGVEGGITNGEPLTISAYLKPLSTLMRPLPSVDLATKAPGNAQKERSDVCAVPAAAVIGESVMALCLAEFVREKFGSDSMKELVRNYMGYKKQLEDY